MATPSQAKLRLVKGGLESPRGVVHECCDGLRRLIRENNSDWHPDHLNGLNRLLKEHEQSAKSVAELKKRFEAVAKDPDAMAARKRMQGVFEGTVPAVGQERAWKAVRSTIDEVKYGKVLNSIYAQELLNHFEAYKRLEKQRFKELRAA